MRSVFSFFVTWAAPLPIRWSVVFALLFSFTLTIFMYVKNNAIGLGRMPFTYELACFSACMSAWVIGRVLFKNELIILTSLLIVQAGEKPQRIEAPFLLVSFAASLAFVSSICFAILKKALFASERKNDRKRD